MTAMEIIQVAGVVIVQVTRAAMAESAAWGQNADCSSMAKPQGALARAAAAHMSLGCSWTLTLTCCVACVTRRQPNCSGFPSHVG